MHGVSVGKSEDLAPGCSMMTLRKWPRLPASPPNRCLSCLFRLQTLQGQKSHTKLLNCANITCSHQANNSTYMKWSNSWNCASHSSVSRQGIHYSKGGRERLRGAKTPWVFKKKYLQYMKLQSLVHKVSYTPNSFLQGWGVAFFVCQVF